MSIFAQLAPKFASKGIPALAFVMPLLCFWIAASVVPAYSQLAFADPFGIWLLGAMFLWNCIGLVLSFVFPSNLVKVIVGVLFCIPLCAFAFFVPATVIGLHSCVKISG
jgi:hypothetical protein